MEKNNKHSDDYELEMFIKMIEKDYLIQAPKQLKQEILTASNRIQIQTAVAKNRVSARVELFWYSLKITVAVAGTFIFFSAIDRGIPIIRPEINLTPQFSVIEMLDQGSSQVTGMLSKFADKIVDE